jgi:hypothetical protein
MAIDKEEGGVVEVVVTGVNERIVCLCFKVQKRNFGIRLTKTCVNFFLVNMKPPTSR